jgi:hypothetical protein
MLEHLLGAEVQRLLVLVGGDHIPGDAAATEVIQGREQPRQQERGIEGGRQRERQANVARRRGQDGDEGTRVMKGRVLGVAEIGIHAPLICPRHRETVAEHEQVELGAFERAGHVLPELRLGPGIPGPGLRACPAIEAESRMRAKGTKP